jgi:Co/Zn/Cd efflux system component
MLNVKAEVIPVITGATGSISKSLRQFLSNIKGKHEIKELKNSHIWHRTHTVESANVKVKNTIHGRENVTCSTYCKHRTAETQFVSSM